MFYTLILSLEYKKYKGPANVSIALNGKVLDSFVVDSDKGRTTKMLSYLEKSCLEKIDRKRWLEREDWIYDWTEYNGGWPTFYKVYKINEKDLESAMITITVDNKNSDYTNGFMKNSSMMKIPIIALVPTQLLANKSEKYFRLLKRIDDAWNKFVLRKNLKKSHSEHNTDEELKFRKDRKVYSWPFVESFMLNREFKNKGEAEVADRYCWIGGSFKIDIPIRTKFNTKYLGNPRAPEMSFPDFANPEAIIIGAMKQLLNIYNEDN